LLLVLLGDGSVVSVGEEIWEDMAGRAADRFFGVGVGEGGEGFCSLVEVKV